MSTLISRYAQRFAASLASATATAGAALVGFLQAGAGAIARTVLAKLRERVSVLDYGADATGATDSTAAFAAALTYLVGLGGGVLWVPRGTYLLNGAAGLDTFKNGILLPDTNGAFATLKGIHIRGEGNESVLVAGSTNMIVVRMARIYSSIRGVKIDGAGLAGTWGVGFVPESVTQTTEVTSNSFSQASEMDIENCTEGMVFQPGPTVTGTDSGAFYFKVSRVNFNLNTRGMWLKKDVTGAGNRVTRSLFEHCTFLRANTGVWIDGGTELDFVACNYEMINTGVTPSATPTAFNYADTNPANIRIFGGYAEACSANIKAAHPEQVQLFGFLHTGASDASEASMGAFVTGRMNVAKLTNTPAYISAGDTSFAALVVDPDANGQKTAEIQTNGVARMRWFNGVTTHKGSLGDVTLGANGAAFTWAYTGNITYQYGTGASLLNHCDHQYWRSAAGADVVRCDTVGTLSLFPASDNAIVLGQNGLRWSAVWAANGTIQTSDPRTKKDVADSVLGLDFIRALRPVSYRFIVGGNEIVGTREVEPAVMGTDDEGEAIELLPAKTENVVQAVPGKRQHFGFLTTEVKAALNGVDFGGYIKTDPNDPQSEEALRYDEFIAPLVKAVQELAAKVDALQAAHAS